MSFMPMSRSIFCGLVALLLTGCNAVYFYETEKASLTIELRPDPTAPVSGNFGLKQRVVAIVPPTVDSDRESRQATPEQTKVLLDDADAKCTAAEAAVKTATTAPAHRRRALASEAAVKQRAAAHALEKVIRNTQDPAGDCLSVISSFKFHKFPRTGGAAFGRISVDATLITGDAAKSVADDNQTAEAISALSGMPVTSTHQLHFAAAVRTIVDGLREKAQSDLVAKQLLANLSMLAADLPPNYGITLYELGEKGIKVSVKPTDPIAGIDGIAKLLTYHETLNAAADSLRGILKDMSAGKPFQMVGPEELADPAKRSEPIDPKSPKGELIQQAMQSQLARIEALDEPVQRKIVQSAAYRAATNYYLGL